MRRQEEGPFRLKGLGVGSVFLWFRQEELCCLMFNMIGLFQCSALKIHQKYIIVMLIKIIMWSNIWFSSLCLLLLDFPCDTCILVFCLTFLNLRSRHLHRWLSIAHSPDHSRNSILQDHQLHMCPCYLRPSSRSKLFPQQLSGTLAECYYLPWLWWYTSGCWGGGKGAIVAKNVACSFSCHRMTAFGSFIDCCCVMHLNIMILDSGM